ncbi:MAG: HDOD domain-containing protein, partial [candidate division Zixibacteria bacterium]|nr:HDOD domain-containing protein [candidate division Zixibacteria bacterium]
MSPIIAKELRDKLEKLSNLPSMPQIIIKIKQISENPKSSVADLANVILSDHQLTSRILRMANSSYYSDFSGRINTITHAIVLMGFRAVRNIAISMAIYGAVNKICRVARFELASFWTRSLACGVIAKFLAHRMNQHELIEAAFIAGFMHDIGQVILAGVFPEKYDEINTLESPDVHLTETVLMGINHLEAGGYVARKWNLPEDLVKAIAEHHRLDKDP